MAAAQDPALTRRAPSFLAGVGASPIRRQLLGLMAALALPFIVAFATWLPAMHGADADHRLPLPAVAAALLLALAALGLAFVFARRLGETAATLAAAATAFAQGDRRRIACGGPAELRAVAKEWNAMLDAAEVADQEARSWTRELEVLVGSIGSAVFAVVPGGERVLFASEQMRAIYGLGPEAFHASPFLWHELIHAADKGVLANLTRQLRRSGRFDVEYRIQRVGGGIRWVRHRGRMLLDEAGRQQRITGVITDISRRKERELRLQASESRLAGLIRASMDGIVTIDEKGRIVLYNPAAERMFGRPQTDAIGMPVDDLLATASRGSFLALDAEGGGSEIPALRVVMGRRGDGSEFTMEAKVARHAVGEHRYVTATLRDITERLAAEKRLHQLSSAVEQSPVSIVITDTDLHICYVNQRFCEVTGYAAEEVLGRRTSILKSGETPDEEYRRLRATIAAGGEWRGEFHNRRKDGSRFWESVRIIPITDSNGEITHFLGHKEDITEKKAMDERERQRREQLAHSARLMLLGEMASSLAHEINQPLTAIAGYSSVCARAAKASPEALALLTKIDEQVARAGEIVWRTRNFSRRQSCRESIDMPALILGAMEWVSDEARRYGIVLDTGAVDRALPEVRADRLQVEQVLLNLLQNAFDALRGVDTPRQVSVAARYVSDGAGVVVSVNDTGCGVPAQVALDVFQPFFTTKPTGLGLGLAISRSIIEDHGGSLWYVPLSGGGTSFHFSLPTDITPPSYPV